MAVDDLVIYIVNTMAVDDLVIHIVNTMAADDLATQRARASSTMIFALLNRINSVPAR